jgi:hypothetical protein
MIYAVLNNSGIVKGVSDLVGEVVDSKMIEIPTFDQTLIGKKWNGATFVPSGIVPPAPVNPLAEIQAKLDKLEKDIKEVKDKIK